MKSYNCGGGEREREIKGGRKRIEGDADESVSPRTKKGKRKKKKKEKKRVLGGFVTLVDAYRAKTRPFVSRPAGFSLDSPSCIFQHKQPGYCFRVRGFLRSLGKIPTP